MTLYEACKNREYTVEGLFVEAAVTRRLQALGIIQVRGTRLALGRHLSSNIEVSEYTREG